VIESPRTHMSSTDAPTPKNAAIPVAKRRDDSAQTFISIVVPCLNEEASLHLLFDALQRVASTWNAEYEVLIIDDGSEDGTWEVIHQLHLRDPRWKGIRLGRNFGHQLALRAGLDHARGNIVMVMDADLQDPPEVLTWMLEHWRSGYDVAVGVRRRRKEAWWKRTAYFSFYRLLALVAELRMPLDAGDFCLMDRRVVDVIRRMPESRPFIRGLRSYVGFQQILVPYDRAPRQTGTTKYSFFGLCRLAADGILSNSRVPLHLATAMGVFVSTLAFFAMILTMVIRLFPDFFLSWGIQYVPGSATVIICTLFMGGVQLVCLGIIGAYLGRVHENVMRRPLWTTLDIVGDIRPHTTYDIDKRCLDT